jgi:predicted dehydrogenase
MGRLGLSGRLRVGLVGTGFIGAVHARSIRAAGAELVAVASSTPASAVDAAHRLGAGRAAESPEALVTSTDLDVVHIAAPNHLHAELTLAALAAGKHVVCEKPLAVSVAEATRMSDAATAGGLVGAVPFVNRYYPMAREARAQLASGRHGSIHTIHGSYLQDWLRAPGETNWRVDARRGGPSRAFADIGSHWCDLVEWMTGERITELVATTATSVSDRPIGDRPTFSANGSSTAGRTGSVDIAEPSRAVDTEDVACVLFLTSGGATGTLTVSQVAAGRKNRLLVEVDATEHSLAFNQEDAERLWVGGQRGSELIARDPAQLSPQAQPYAVLPVGHVQGFHDCFDAFVADVYRSITDGAPVDGLPTFADGVRSAQIVEAVLASANKHSWIEV